MERGICYGYDEKFAGKVNKRYGASEIPMPHIFAMIATGKIRWQSRGISAFFEVNDLAVFAAMFGGRIKRGVGEFECYDKIKLFNKKAYIAAVIVRYISLFDALCVNVVPHAEGVALNYFIEACFAFA